MRLLTRPKAPSVLAKNAEEWTKKYQEKRKAGSTEHPRSSQYAHKDVLDSLERMSYFKCFYCEKKVKSGVPSQVDHYKESSLFPELAFDWQNLYLSCTECNNGKPDNDDLPVTDCLDPCGTIPPEEHLRFEDEVIRSVSSSTLGLNTIKKYKLDRLELEQKRARSLITILKLVSELRVLAERHQNTPLPPAYSEALTKLRALGDRDAPLSLFCSLLIKEFGFAQPG